MSNEEPTVMVLHTNNITEVAKFFERMGLKMTPEVHGNGPAHFSLERKGLVLEIYPPHKSGEVVRFML